MQFACGVDLNLILVLNLILDCRLNTKLGCGVFAEIRLRLTTRLSSQLKPGFRAELARKLKSDLV